MGLDLSTLITDLTNCTGPENCSKCSYLPVVGSKLVCKTVLLKSALQTIRLQKSLSEAPPPSPSACLLTAGDILLRKEDPLYIITDPPDIDTWMFYVGHIERKGLFLFRDPDGSVHDFWEKEYGKTWLAFSGRVTDKEWEEAKKEMDSNQTES